MAEEIAIKGSNEVGKIRHPLGVVGLTLITLGIYYIVWYFKVNKEMAALGQARGSVEAGDNPGKSLLAMTLGILIIVPPFLSLFGTWKRLNASERLTGLPTGMAAGLGFVISLFVGPVGTYILQSNLNKVLEQQARAA